MFWRNKKVYSKFLSRFSASEYFYYERSDFFPLSISFRFWTKYSTLTHKKEYEFRSPFTWTVDRVVEYIKFYNPRKHMSLGCRICWNFSSKIVHCTKLKTTEQVKCTLTVTWRGKATAQSLHFFSKVTSPLGPQTYLMNREKTNRMGDRTQLSTQVN